MASVVIFWISSKGATVNRSKKESAEIKDRYGIEGWINMDAKHNTSCVSVLSSHDGLVSESQHQPYGIVFFFFVRS